MSTIAHCAGCPYREFGPAIGTRGDSNCSIVLVGEAPGAKEVVEGRPFVGPAGQVLWRAVADAGLREADVYVVNSVACRPRDPVKPSFRAPSLRAVDACRDRLLRDIGLHPRAAIVALGGTAVRAVTGRRGLLVTKLAPGTELETEWGPVVPTLHPAFVLRAGPSGPERRRLVDDLTHARSIVSDGHRRLIVRVPP